MKNLKKLFVVLPLVLVMLLTAVPVFANGYVSCGENEQNSCKEYVIANGYVESGLLGNEFSANVLNQTKFSKDDYYFYLNQSTKTYPVWVGEKTPFKKGSNITLVENREYVKLLNGGGIDGWVEYNWDVTGALGAARAYIENSHPNYAIPSFQIHNVYKVSKKVMVPETWLEERFQPSKQATALVEGEQKVVGQEVVNVTKCGGEVVQEEKTEYVLSQDINLKNAGEKVELADLYKLGLTLAGATNDNRYDIKDAAGNVYQAYVDDKENPTTFTLVDSIPYIKAGTPVQGLIDSKDFKWVDAEAKAEITVDQEKKVTGNFPVRALVTKVNKTEVKDIKAPTTNEVKVVDKNGKPVIVNAADPNKLVEAYVEGFLIIVEKTTVPVTITHHFLLENNEEFQKETKQDWPKNKGELTVTNVDPAWYITNLEGWTIKTDSTRVEGDYDNYELTLGENLLKGYKVDLYYTAAENAEGGEAIDAAIAGQVAGVQAEGNVSAAAQLPATGAADSIAVVLSSVAMVVIGLFLKK